MLYSEILRLRMRGISIDIVMRADASFYHLFPKAFLLVIDIHNTMIQLYTNRMNDKM